MKTLKDFLFYAKLFFLKLIFCKVDSLKFITMAPALRISSLYVCVKRLRFSQ